MLHYLSDNNEGGGHQRRQPDIAEGPVTPAESDSTSGCSSAAASNLEGDGSQRRSVQSPDQPRPTPPLTSSDAASACCGCTGDRDGSTWPSDRSVSRGVGYCCTVQPIDRRPVTPTSSTPQPADELLLTGPRFVSPADRRSLRRQPPPLPPPRRTSLKADANSQLI